MDLEERALVRDDVHQVVHVIRLVRRRRDQCLERFVLPIDRIRGLAPGRVVDVVGRQVAEQLTDGPQAFAIVRRGKVRDAADLVVRLRAAELFLGDFLVRHRLDDVRPGHEHVARALDHDGEVGDRR